MATRRIRKGFTTVEYVVGYFDPRGAWRELDDCETEEAARDLVKIEKLDRWYIEKRTREIIDCKNLEGKK